jgi:Na+-transporting NADH:ubiquinone oxidoreductase subunit B
MLKQYLQPQRPMAAMLTALSLPLLFGIYNFGWRVLAVAALSAALCWSVEYLFTRQEGKPATMSALVTAVLLALVLPPNVPFWMLAVGAVFAMVFGKMVYGGFGKNIFNPAMVGRCFLYVCFPVALTGTWYAPVGGAAGGFAAWTTQQPPREIEHPSDAVSGATILTAAKQLNRTAREARTEADAGAKNAESAAAGETYRAARETFRRVPLVEAMVGRISGSMGETSALAIFLALLFLLYKKVLQTPLFLGPVLGMLLGIGLYRLTGDSVLPLPQVVGANFLAGGTLFAIVFMTTEPVSAPTHPRAKWIYGLLIGFFASTIRTRSVFNAGLMFSILLGNMFGPIIDHYCKEYDAWRQSRAEARERRAAETGATAAREAT